MLSRSKHRWQFSLRALLILMAVVAAMTAFAANYPEIALLIALGTVWVLFESAGAIVQFVAYLAEPRVFDRHPLLATIVWFFVGLLSFAISGFFVWPLFHPREVVPFLLQSLMAILFASFGSYCSWLLWKSFQKPVDAEHAGTTDERQP